MAAGESGTGKGQFTASVLANKRIGQQYYRLQLEFGGTGAKVLAESKPGQFVQLDVSTAALPAPKAMPAELADKAGRGILLRRPFSFCSVDPKRQRTLAEILYCVVGPASCRMSGLSERDRISMLGPLGNGFSVPEGKKKALLVAGGMGAGPLLHLAKMLSGKHSDIETTAFAGARTKFDLPFQRRTNNISQHIGFAIAEFGSYGIESFIATDDGSAGFAGPVTECLANWLEEHKPAGEETVIYACGPEAMLAKVAQMAAEQNMDCQVSMERMMACGIGVCQSCAVECKVGDSKETVYKLCCKDGPVFDAKEVVFSL